MNAQAQKIRAEIERRITMLRIGCKHSEANELLPILSFIDSLQDEPNTEETELNSIAFLEQLGYNCIPPKESWPPQDTTPTYASTEYKVSKELSTNPNMESSNAKCGKLDELEEEVNRYWNDHALEYRLGRVADIDFLHLTARHFAEWGYLRAVEKYNEIEYNRQRAEEDTPNDLEEAEKEYAGDSVSDEGIMEVAAFIAGAKWQKLKDEERK